MKRWNEGDASCRRMKYLVEKHRKFVNEYEKRRKLWKAPSKPTLRDRRSPGLSK